MQNFLALWLHLIVYGFISLDSPSRWNIPWCMEAKGFSRA
jgi:hypothetical protein